MRDPRPPAIVDASAPAPAQAEASPATATAVRRTIVHPWLRWPFRIYNTALVFVALALLGNIAVAPLARGTKNWASDARAQVRALLDFVGSHVPLSLTITVVLIVLYALGLVARREWAREVAQADQERVAATAQAAAQAEVREILPGAFAQAVAQAAERAAAAAPAVPAGVVSPSGLPRPGTLVGREAELAALGRRLRAGGSVGVFAVEGLAGVGKTALAATAVARLAADRATFPGGAAWLSCEGLSGAAGLDALWSSVARALGAADVAALPDPEARRAALRAALSDPARPRLLLALDNVEPGLDAEALLDTLAGGRATLLLTARQAVAPARLETIELEPLADPEAVKLLTARLRQVDASRPTADEQGATVELAALLGGLPLAIELAAAYAGVQRRPLAAVVAEVRGAAMGGGPLRGLRARFERSWQVLTGAQQRLFAGLSIMEGATFPRAAALAIAGAAQDDTPAAEADAAADERATADLDTLVSLALVEPQAAERLRLHPLLREYAGAQLQALPAATAEHLGDALLAYWVEFAQAHDTQGGNDIPAMDALEAEAPGLLAALAWAHAHARWQPLLALAYALGWTWRVRGRVDEARRWRPWAVAAARQGGTPRDQRFMTHALAVLAADTGEVAAARAGFEEALRLAKELGDKSAIQAETHELAVLAGNAGDVAEAIAGYDEALRLARELGDPAAQANELMNLAISHRQGGELALARTELTEALALARQIGHALFTARALSSLGFLARDEGDTQQACQHFREALALFERIGSPEARGPRAMLAELGCAT